MNKSYSKRRPRGRPKKRKGKDRPEKQKETSERDDDEEETPVPAEPMEVKVEKEQEREVNDQALNQTENGILEQSLCPMENGISEQPSSPMENGISYQEQNDYSAMEVEDYDAAHSQDEDAAPDTQYELNGLDLSIKKSIVTQTENCNGVSQNKLSPTSVFPQGKTSARSKGPESTVKEELASVEEEDIEDELQSQVPTLPLESPLASTSSAPAEAVVAQLNQLQETVVSHILQYQAGVLAQFQQLQQQMLSGLSTVAQQPQLTVTPVVKTEPNGRKRRASKPDITFPEEDTSKSGESQAKRKRTAFSEKQYEILETTFQHNNFPEPIDQHCIALRIKTPYRSIKMWFQNRRASVRKRMHPKIKGEEGVEKKPSKPNCDPDTRWYCTLCPSTFISKKFLDFHKEAHEKETLRCSNCNMAFTHKILLETHKISKCNSISGVDLSHLEEEQKELNKSHDKINFIKALSKDPKGSESISISSASLPLLLQKLQNQQPKKEGGLASPPPSQDQSSLNSTTSPKLENSLLVQQQLMQQLLLAQLQQAAQLKAKQESEELETPNEEESTNSSLTLGGLTIFPVKSPNGKREIKEEPKPAPLEDLPELQPSTLQEQITSIFQNQELKALSEKVSGEDSKVMSKESMKEQIQAILRHQEEQRKQTTKNVSQGGDSQEEESLDLESLKRHRRRTTVFNEVQLRTLYMHFTHCNFPDPAMFKIIGHLVKLDPQVIKIWFQNERSRQRKRATHIVDEASAKDKPYKCRDCGMSFAMMTFLVKHSMRHIGETDQDANLRTCPLCLQKWTREVFSSHLKSRHNVNLNLVEERNRGTLKCYLCSETFPDQENLMIHKHKHLKDDYDDPPQCSKCKTTFVNAICLEAHMETHELGEWTHKCDLCCAIFHDKVLLTSHEMGHGVPLAPVSTIDRSRSQLQHSNMRTVNTLSRKTVASVIESLCSKPLQESQEEGKPPESDDLKSENNMPVKTSISSKVVPVAISPQKTTPVTPVLSIPTFTASLSSSLGSPTSISPSSSLSSATTNSPPSSVSSGTLKLLTSSMSSGTLKSPTSSVSSATSTSPTSSLSSTTSSLSSATSTSPSRLTSTTSTSPSLIKTTSTSSTLGGIVLSASTTTPSVSMSTSPIGSVVSPPPPGGPVSYVKLIPVQLIPTAPVPNSQAGTPNPGVITGPTTAFISVPVNFVGTGETNSAGNPIFNQLVDPSNGPLKLAMADPSGGGIKLALCNPMGGLGKPLVPESPTSGAKSVVPESSSGSGKPASSAPSPIIDGVKLPLSTLAGDKLKLTGSNPTLEPLRLNVSNPNTHLKFTPTKVTFSSPNDALPLTPISSPNASFKLGTATTDALKLGALCPPNSALKLVTSPQSDTGKLVNANLSSNVLKLAVSCPQINAARLSIPDNLTASSPSKGTVKVSNTLTSPVKSGSPIKKGTKKKALPNLIPINMAKIPKIKQEIEDEQAKDLVFKPAHQDTPSCSDSQNAETEMNGHLADGTPSPLTGIEMREQKYTPGVANSEKGASSSEEGADKVHARRTVDVAIEAKGLPEDLSLTNDQKLLQGLGKKRYVPILPLLPLQLSDKEGKLTSINPILETPIPKRPKSSRNVPNKRLWEAYKVERYKKRRTPTYFSGMQREMLEAHFDHDHFPEPGEQLALSDQLGVSYAVVKTWFQNTRKNFRKQLKLDKNSPDRGPFHCSKCSVAFISKGSLNEHLEVHSVATGIKCDECDLNFSHQSVLKTHYAVIHKLGKSVDAKGRKRYGRDYGRDVVKRILSSHIQEDGESDSDSHNEDGEEESPKTKLSDPVPHKTERPMEDSLDGEDYPPIMSVECILNSSEGEGEGEGDEGIQKAGEESEQCGHKCHSCKESFASLIALKEHNSHLCSEQKEQKFLKPGHFRRKKKMLLKKRCVGSSIRCFDCYTLFTNRNTYLEHFKTHPCTFSSKRIEYTDEEQKVLCTHYDGNNFPLPSEMSLLARRLGVRYRQVMHWFQNRRSKERKKNKEGGKSPPVQCHKCKASFVTHENMSHHRKIVHGDSDNSASEETGSSSVMVHACDSPGCGAFFPNAELLVTHSLAHQVDMDPVQTDEESDSQKPSNLGPTILWKDFAVLEAHYSDNNFPDPMDIGFIARRLQVDPLNVHLWFKERRLQHIRKLEENGTKVMEGEAAVSTQKALSKICTKCNAAFICQSDLTTHEDMHKSSWSQVCSMCGLEFSNIVVLETHWIRHGVEVTKDKKRESADRPTKISFSNVQMEVLDAHYENNNFPMALEIWLIATRLTLRPRQVTHWFQNKRGRDRRLQKITAAFSRICVLCGASFICDAFLNKHLKTHKTDARFQCADCKVEFLSSVLLETHALYHTSVPKDKVPRRAPDGVKDPMIEGQVRKTVKLEPAEDPLPGDQPSNAVKKEPVEEVEDPVTDPAESENKHLDNSEGGLPIKAEPSEKEQGKEEVENNDEPLDFSIKREPAGDDEHSDSSEGELRIDESEDYSLMMEDNKDEDSYGEPMEDDGEHDAAISDKEYDSDTEENKTGSCMSALDEDADAVVSNEDGMDEEESTQEPQSLLEPQPRPVEDQRVDSPQGNFPNNRMGQEVFFDDVTDSSDDDEDEPRLRIVSAYAISANPEDIGSEEEL